MSSEHWCVRTKQSHPNGGTSSVDWKSVHRINDILWIHFKYAVEWPLNPPGLGAFWQKRPQNRLFTVQFTPFSSTTTTGDGDGTYECGLTSCMHMSGFGMECWGLKVWGSLESWVRVRVTGSDGSPRINLIQMDLMTDGLWGSLGKFPTFPGCLLSR